MNPLREAMQDYLAMRRELGFKMYEAGLKLPRFIEFLEQRKAPHITVALALEWAQCPRRSRSEPPGRLRSEPGVEADFAMVGCG